MNGELCHLLFINYYCPCFRRDDNIISLWLKQRCSPHEICKTVISQGKSVSNRRLFEKNRGKNGGKSQFCVGFWCFFVVNLKKQTVRQVKLVQFSRFESCPAKVSRPAGMNTCVSGGNKWYEAM